jgi:hypothetical protein
MRPLTTTDAAVAKRPPSGILRERDLRERIPLAAEER